MLHWVVIWTSFACELVLLTALSLPNSQHLAKILSDAKQQPNIQNILKIYFAFSAFFCLGKAILFRISFKRIQFFKKDVVSNCLEVPQQKMLIIIGLIFI